VEKPLWRGEKGYYAANGIENEIDRTKGNRKILTVGMNWGSNYESGVVSR
jgi:hypothetical protein